MRDTDPDKQPIVGNYIGCPPTKHRPPVFSKVSGKFRDLDELLSFYHEDVRNLSLDLSNSLDCEFPMKRIIQGFSGSYGGPVQVNYKYVPFDSSKFNKFVRLYSGNAAFGEYLLSQYEIAVSGDFFAMLFYAETDGKKILLLRTNDYEYVDSASGMTCGAVILGRLLDQKRLRGTG